MIDAEASLAVAATERHLPALLVTRDGGLSASWSCGISAGRQRDWPARKVAEAARLDLPIVSADEDMSAVYEKMARSRGRRSRSVTRRARSG